MELAATLKTLRKKHEWTQQQLADRIGIKRSLVGAYEEGRAEPKLDTLMALARIFQTSLDTLVSGISSKRTDAIDTERLAGRKLRVLAVPIDPETNRERISLVPVKAAAGYLGGYGDIDFIEALPQFSLPIPELSTEETRRVFQIQGDSMLPFLPGSYVISSYVQDWRSIKTGELYVFLTQDQGVVFKRATNHIASTGEIELVSDNLIYAPYRVHVEDLLEVLKVQGSIQWDLSTLFGVDDIVLNRLDALQQEIRALRTELGKNVA